MISANPCRWTLKKRLFLDTTICIDLFNGRLLEKVLTLPYEFVLPDVIVAERDVVLPGRLVDFRLVAVPRRTPPLPATAGEAGATRRAAAGGVKLRPQVLRPRVSKFIQVNYFIL